MRRIADRDRVAFGLLYRRLVGPVFAQARAGLGSAAVAVQVTREVFVEVWRLAPASDGRRDDVRVWVAGITVARIAARLPVLCDDLRVVTVAGEQIGCERIALLDAASVPGAGLRLGVRLSGVAFAGGAGLDTNPSLALSAPSRESRHIGHEDPTKRG